MIQIILQCRVFSFTWMHINRWIYFTLCNFFIFTIKLIFDYCVFTQHSLYINKIYLAKYNYRYIISVYSQQYNQIFVCFLLILWLASQLGVMNLFNNLPVFLRKPLQLNTFFAIKQLIELVLHSYRNLVDSIFMCKQSYFGKQWHLV